MNMCESFKIISNKWYLSSNSNAIFGFTSKIENNLYKITNHISLIFKLLNKWNKENKKRFSPKSCKQTGTV